MILLAIDVGNTNITFGLFEDGEAKTAFRIRTIHDKTHDEYAVLVESLIRRRGYNPESIGSAVIASVVPPLTPVFVQLCREYLRSEPLVVGAGIKTGIKIRYEDPREVGADRVVDAAAVKEYYGVPAVVVDFGTATTFDAINGEAEYLGGAITPGIGIASAALFEKTSKLPKVDLSRPPSVIGRNTVNAIQSGLLYGYVSLVEGMVARFKAELGPETKVIATGGLAELISKETTVFDVVDQWLTLKGLVLIYEFNKAKEHRTA